MTLHDFISEYQDQTGRNISKKVTGFFTALDAALNSFSQLGISDCKKGIAPRDEDEFIQWAEDAIPGSSERDAEIASFIGEIAFEKYSEGYSNVPTAEATHEVLTCNHCTDKGHCPEYTPAGVCVSKRTGVSV